MSCCSHAPVGVFGLAGAPLTAHGAVATAASVCDVIRSDFSMHDDGVRLLFDDLEPEPLIETQQRFAGYEAQADR